MMESTLAFPLLRFPSRPAAGEALASALASRVAEAHKAGRRARIALSGGSSPEPAYRAFAALDLNWSQIDIALVDDRWVSTDNPGSNQAMIERAFGAATGVSIHGLVRPTLSARQAEADINAIMAELRPFDAIVLGMGPDAHTASWFPGSPDLAACLNPETRASVIGVDAGQAPVALPYRERMTMTLPCVREAGHVLLLLFGDDKKAILESAVTAPITQAPIRAAIEAAGPRFVTFWAS